MLNVDEFFGMRRFYFLTSVDKQYYASAFCRTRLLNVFIDLALGICCFKALAYYHCQTL